MRCLVSIFTVRIKSKSIPLAIRSIQERYLEVEQYRRTASYYNVHPNLISKPSREL